jgi:hypothetical protein
MAIVREYDRQVGAPSADMGRRADASDMGFAQGLYDLGQGISQGLNVMAKYEEQREISDAQIKLAEADAEWDAKMRADRETATPGVSTAIQTKAGMTDYFTKMQQNYKTKAAQQYIALHGTKMTTSATNQAAAFDLDLSVRDRKVKREQIGDGLAKQSFADPGKYEELKNRLITDSEAGVGNYAKSGDARYDVAMGAELSKTVQNMAFMAAQGAIQDPAFRGTLVGSVKGAVTNLPFDAVFDKVLSAESGKKQVDSGGNPITSPKGAIGIAQVMPGTAPEAAKLAGLPWDEQKYKYDAEYNKALGKAYLQAKISEFDGDVAKGLAAYNAGASRVMSAVGSRGTDWLSGMPQETQQYVKKIAGNDVGVDVVEKPPELKQKPAWWDDMSVEQQIQVTRAAQTLEKQNRNIADRANAKLINDEQNHFAATGKLSENAPKMSSVTDPEQRQELQTLYDASNKLAGIMDKPAAEQNAFLAANKPEASGIPGDYTHKLRVYGQMVKFVQDNQKLRQEDQVTAAYRMGFGGKQAEIKPITDYADGDKLGLELSTRVAHTDAIQKTWGMKDNKILMENEAQNVRNKFRDLKVEEQPAYLAGLAKNITKEHFDALTQQVWKNDHEIRGAAILSNLGTSKSQNGSSAQRTSELILLGRKVLDSNVIKEGGEKMPGFKGVLPSDESVREYVGAHLAGQYLPETTINALVQNVKAHYIGHLQTKGVQKTYELDESDNKTYLKDSIKTVIGEPSTVGPTKVTRPWGMSDAQFQEEVKNQAADMGYLGRNYGLIALEGKKYALTINGVAKETIDFNQYSLRGLPNAAYAPEEKKTGVYADAFNPASVKEALGISGFKLPKGRADELGWWEQ